MAGSQNVLELHGSIHRNYCQRCAKFYDAEYLLANTEDIPHCTCGGIIKPDVVLYEEGLDMQVVSKAIQYISRLTSSSWAALLWWFTRRPASSTTIMERNW